MANYTAVSVHLDPPKSPFLRGTFFVPPFLRGARGDLTYLIISKSAVILTTSQKLCNTLVDRVAFFWEIGMRGGDGGDVNYTRLLK